MPFGVAIIVRYKVRVAAPNDPKLSDGGGLAQPVPTGGSQESRPESESAPDAEAQAVTDRSRSLQRMVRPIELTPLGEELYRRGCRETAPDGIITEEFLNRFGMSFGGVQESEQDAQAR